MRRLLSIFVAALALVWAQAAFAQVTISFHSFNGSVLVGRYPHTFVVMRGTLEKTGEKVNENYGFTARRVGPAVLSGPVEHEVYVEKQKYIESTNRHFTLPMTDAQYWKVRAEVDKWRSAPGKYYDLDTRNCIHFVGAIAQIMGVTVDYPQDMLRRPKAWLNYLIGKNPQLGARQID